MARIGLLLAISLLVAACGGESAPAKSDTAVPAAPPPATPAAPPSANIQPIEIVSVDPETLPIVNGRARPTLFAVEYRIARPEAVEKAEVVLHAPGISDVVKKEVPIEASRRVYVALERDFDFGPKVRFRAICPGGTTEWHTLGEPPVPAEKRTASGVAIWSVGPSSIGFDRSGLEGTAVRFGMTGQGLSSECKAEGQVNGRPMELFTVLFFDRKLQGTFNRSELDNREVSARYLEVKVSIRGARLGQVAIKRIPFVE
jgi:hypothetical protein